MIIQKMITMPFASCVGLVATTVAITPVIAVMNYLATDGPYFPPPLVAFGLFALPIGVLLFLVEASVVTYEAIARRDRGNAWLMLGVISGLASGIVWYLVLASLELNVWLPLAVCVVSMFQALLVFGCHWIAYKLTGAV